jgi:hypothetical protein
VTRVRAPRQVTLTLLPVGGGGTCVCAGKPAPFGAQKGKLLYTPNTTQAGEKGPAGSVSFGNNCAPAPRTVLLEQQNPTCDIRTYVGGQTACHHMWSLLDADQDIPWADQPLEYHLKVRFWVQPYNGARPRRPAARWTSASGIGPTARTQARADWCVMPRPARPAASYHTNVAHKATWGIASPVEYDIPKCDATIPGCAPVPGSHNAHGAEGKEWVHTIEGVYKVATGGKVIFLRATRFHYMDIPSRMVLGEPL